VPGNSFIAEAAIAIAIPKARSVTRGLTPSASAIPGQGMVASCAAVLDPRPAPTAGGPRGRPVLAATASRTGVGFPGLAFGLEPMKQAKQQHRATSDHHCSGHKLSTDAQRDSKLLTHGQR
jgi:hypothetical protein